MALKTFFSSFLAAALVVGLVAGCEGGGEAPVEQVEAQVPKKPRKRLPVAEAASPVPSAQASTAPSRSRAFLASNVAYDRMRTRAMAMVYDGQTKKAMNTFESVQQLRPEDPAVRMWISAIRESAKTAREAAPTAQDDFRNAAQQLRGGAPLPAGLSAPPYGGAPALAAPRLPRTPGGASGGAQPVPVPSPVEIDPRLVF